MTRQPDFKRIIRDLQAFGVSSQGPGFPVRLNGSDGHELDLWLSNPALLADFSPHDTGVATFSLIGELQSTWGIASEFLDSSDPSIKELVSRAAKKGSATLTLDQTYCVATKSRDVIVVLALLIEELSEAYLALRNAEREVEALRRIGKSLAMNQTLQPLALMTAHAIQGALDLAAVMLWTNGNEDDVMELVAYGGIDREGSRLLANLQLKGRPAFLAEHVAATGEPVWIERADQHTYTADLELKHCYLTAGPIAAMPLRTGQKTIGVLEMVGKQNDLDFLESDELHLTIAEHLALALNSAMLFEKIETLAFLDPLTGIANHRTLQEFVAKAIQTAKRDRKPLGVVMVDVDNFRRFNEEEGHDAGDEVLRRVAQVLKSNMRQQDLAARYGGEEFTLVLPGMDARSTTALAERVRTEIVSLGYKTKDGHEKPITVSLGCSVFPFAAKHHQELLKAADVALYQAKRNGRNQVVLSPDSNGPAKAG